MPIGGDSGKKVKKYIPPVPIQTYKWEDVRRSRRKGGYPWTHLYKSSLTDEEECSIMDEVKEKTKKVKKSKKAPELKPTEPAKPAEIQESEVIIIRLRDDIEDDVLKEKVEDIQDVTHEDAKGDKLKIEKADEKKNDEGGITEVKQKQQVELAKEVHAKDLDIQKRTDDTEKQVTSSNESKEISKKPMRRWDESVEEQEIPRDTQSADNTTEDVKSPEKSRMRRWDEPVEHTEMPKEAEIKHVEKKQENKPRMRRWDEPIDDVEISKTEDLKPEEKVAEDTNAIEKPRMRRWDEPVEEIQSKTEVTESDAIKEIEEKPKMRRWDEPVDDIPAETNDADMEMQTGELAVKSDSNVEEPLNIPQTEEEFNYELSLKSTVTDEDILAAGNRICEKVLTEKKKILNPEPKLKRQESIIDKLKEKTRMFKKHKKSDASDHKPEGKDLEKSKPTTPVTATTSKEPDVIIIRLKDENAPETSTEERTADKVEERDKENIVPEASKTENQLVLSEDFKAEPLKKSDSKNILTEQTVALANAPKEEVEEKKDEGIIDKIKDKTKQLIKPKKSNTAKPDPKQLEITVKTEEVSKSEPDITIIRLKDSDNEIIESEPAEIKETMDVDVEDLESSQKETTPQPVLYVQTNIEVSGEKVSKPVTDATKTVEKEQKDKKGESFFGKIKEKTKLLTKRDKTPEGRKRDKTPEVKKRDKTPDAKKKADAPKPPLPPSEKEPDVIIIKLKHDSDEEREVEENKATSSFWEEIAEKPQEELTKESEDVTKKTEENITLAEKPRMRRWDEPVEDAEILKEEKLVGKIEENIPRMRRWDEPVEDIEVPKQEETKSAEKVEENKPRMRRWDEPVEDIEVPKEEETKSFETVVENKPRMRRWDEPVEDVEISKEEDFKFVEKEEECKPQMRRWDEIVEDVKITKEQDINSVEKVEECKPKMRRWDEPVDENNTTETKVSEIALKKDVDVGVSELLQIETTPQLVLSVQTNIAVPEEKQAKSITVTTKKVEKETKEKKGESFFGKIKEKTKLLTKRDKTPEGRKRDKTPEVKKRDKTPDAKKKADAPKPPLPPSEKEPDVIIIKLKHDSDEEREMEENKAASSFWEDNAEKPQEELTKESEDVTNKTEENVKLVEKPRMRRWDEPVEDAEILKEEEKPVEKIEENKPRMRRWDEPVENIDIPKEDEVKRAEKAEEIKPRMRRWDEPIEDVEISKVEDIKPAENIEENKPIMRRWDEPVEDVEITKEEDIKLIEKIEENKPRMRRWDEPVDECEISKDIEENIQKQEKPEDVKLAVENEQIKTSLKEIKKTIVVGVEPKKKEEGFMDMIKEKTKNLGFKKKDKDTLTKKGKTKSTKPEASFEQQLTIDSKEQEPDVVIIKLKHDSDEDNTDDDTLKCTENIPTETTALQEETIDTKQEENHEADVEENSTTDEASQYLDKDEPISQYKQPIIVEKPLKDEDDALPGTSMSKSEEDLKKKRKLSVESKISLSSLGVMKKLRETKDKIKMPAMPKISMPKFQMKKKPELKKVIKIKKEKTKVASVKRKEHSPKQTQKVIEAVKRTKSDSPVYIHIPLKASPKIEKPMNIGLHMDLDDDNEKVQSSEKFAEPEIKTEIDDLPPVVLTKDVVIIPLAVTTHVDSDTSILEEKLKIIDLTKEEPESKGEEIEKPPEKPAKRIRGKKPVSIVDEEDGLKLSPAAIAEALTEIDEEPELKSSLKNEEQKSPVFRKKVSFKKRPSSKASEESRIYESFDIPKDLSPSPKPDDDSEGTSKEESASTVVDNAKREKLKAAQSMSVDEEKSYLDNVLIKTTSLEDDYQKWSKLSDHEYEPINPPGPEISQPPITTQQPVHVDESTGELRHKGSLASSTTSLDRKYLRVPLDDEVVLPVDGEAEDEAMAGKNLGDGASAQDIRPKSEQRYTPETVGSRTESRTDGEFNTSQYNSSILEDLPLHKESRKRATLAQAEGSRGSNIQQTLRNHAGRIKTRLKGIKRPTFTMPSRPKFERPRFQRPKFDRPKFSMPDRPKFSMPDTSRFSLPKMPDRPKINFPSFTFPRRSTNTTRSTKSSGQDMPTSSESNAGGTKRNFFDVRTTYPRIFDKFRKSKEAPDISKKVRKPTPPPEFATVPRAAGRKKGPVGSRWVQRFTDIKFVDDESKKSRSREFGSSTGSPMIESLASKDREDSVERRMAADARYNAAVESLDDEYERENREIHEVVNYGDDLPKRWSHGSFRGSKQHSQDEDEGELNAQIDRRHMQEAIQAADDERRYNAESLQSIDTNQEERASGSSSDRHRRGVLEEIDDDEFFLRQKGISQDNIEVGAYLSSEIREAFRTPVNALSQMNRDNRYYGHEYDLDVSDHSANHPPEPTKRKIKKPKRVKKTPHVSQEEMSYDQDSILTEPEEYPKSYSSYTSVPPARPMRGKKGKKEDVSIPYQETIQADDQFSPIQPEDAEELRRHMQEIEDAQRQEEEEYRVEHLSRYYENELMKDIHQPEIFIVDDPQKDFNSNRYENYQHEDYMSDDQAEFEQSPIAPKRKNKSLRSLNSDADSIFDEINPKREMFGDIPVQEITAYRAEHDFMLVPGERPVPPKRTRSRTRSPRSRTVSVGDEDRTSRGADSIASDAEGLIPCEEPICVIDSRDSMGYAVIDKNKQREPPLPPSRPSIPKRRRSTKSNRSTSSRKSGDTKFFTVPRPLNDVPVPVRPSRNYSTLGPSRPPRRSMDDLEDEEEKENIDITQYIEITDDEPARHLQSGEVIQKMKDRPLPAPPRPPRKTRDSGKDALSDITHEENIIPTSRSLDKTEISPTSKDEIVDEIEVSTQTDPLLEDFVTCDEITEVSEKVSAPRRRRTSSRSSSRFGSKSSMSRKTPDRPRTPVEVIGTEEISIKSRPQTPTMERFENEETITHASLIVQPVDDAQILPNSYVSQRFGNDGMPDLFPSPEKIQEMISDIIAHRESEMAAEKEYDDEESSEIPESFKLLKDPPVETVIQTKRIDEDDYSEIPEDFKKLSVRVAEEKATESEKVVTEPVKAVEVSQTQEAPIQVPVRTKRSIAKQVIEDDYAEIPERLDEVCPPQPPPIETPVRTKRKSDRKTNEGETTEIPIDFHELRDPPAIAQFLPTTSVLQQQQQQPQSQIIERIIERQVPVSVIPGPETVVDLLKTQRLQVGDLDVERLNVTQLQAQRIVVSDIEGGHLSVNEIDSKSGHLIVAGIEFPPNLIKDLLEKLQAAAAAQAPPVPPPRQVINRQTSTDCPTIREEPIIKKTTDGISQVDKSTDERTVSPVLSAPLSAEIVQEVVKTAERIISEQKSQDGEPDKELIKQKSLEEIILAAVEEQIIAQQTLEPITVAPEHKTEEVIVTETEVTSKEEAAKISTVALEERKQEASTAEANISEAHQVEEVAEIIADIPVVIEQITEIPVIDLKEQIVIEKQIITILPEEQETLVPLSAAVEEKEVIEIDKNVIVEEPVSSGRVFTEDAMPATEKSVTEEATSSAGPSLENTEEECASEICSAVPQTDEDSDGQKKTSPTQQSDNIKTEYDSQTESPSPIPSDEVDSVVDLLDDENQLKKNLVEKLVDDIILVAEEFVEKTLDLDESVIQISQTFPLDAAVIEDYFPEALAGAPSRTQEAPGAEDTRPRIPTRPTRAHEVRFTHLTPKSSESDEVPQLIEIHHMEFTRSEDKPPELPPKQRKKLAAQKSSESEAAPERPQLPAFHQSAPFATPFYPEYIPSVPPPSFYSLRARQQEVSDDELPVPPRRRRHHRAVSRSSSEDVHHAMSRRHTTRSPEPSVPQLSGQLARACVSSIDRSIRRVVNHVMTNILGIADEKQDLHVVLIILLVLIAGLILLGFGGDKTVHLHHWEYFNPPRDL